MKYTASMEAGMKKIYKNFDHLMEENKKLFDVLKERGGQGFHRAIWEARDSEIEKLNEKIDEDQKKIKDSKEKVKELRKTVEELKKVLTDQNEVIEESKKVEGTTKYVITGLKEQLKNLDSERKKLLEESSEIKSIKIKMGKVCEEFNQMKKSLDQSQKGEVDLTKMVRNLRIEKKTLEDSLSSIKKREMNLCYELDKYKNNFFKLRKDFKEQQKDLKFNLQKLEVSELMKGKMESELFRLNCDIKSLRPSNLKDLMKTTVEEKSQ